MKRDSPSKTTVDLLIQAIREIHVHLDNDPKIYKTTKNGNKAYSWCINVYLTHSVCFAREWDEFEPESEPMYTMYLWNCYDKSRSNEFSTPDFDIFIDMCTHYVYDHYNTMLEGRRNFLVQGVAPNMPSLRPFDCAKCLWKQHMGFSADTMKALETRFYIM